MASDRMPLSSKATLSVALAKARTAVQLDQAQYHEGARAYYVEVVELLARVIGRASNENDVRKLEDIVSPLMSYKAVGFTSPCLSCSTDADTSDEPTQTAFSNWRNCWLTLETRSWFSVLLVFNKEFTFLRNLHLHG